MSQVIQPVNGAGVKLELDGNGYATLIAATTYFFELPAELAVKPLQSFSAQWDAVIVMTSLSPQDTNIGDATSFADTLGAWLTQNPTTAYVPALGGVATQAVVAVAGGTAGGATWNLSLGSGRKRIKVIVGATGGKLRIFGSGIGMA